MEYNHINLPDREKNKDGTATYFLLFMGVFIWCNQTMWQKTVQCPHQLLMHNKWLYWFFSATHTLLAIEWDGVRLLGRKHCNSTHLLLVIELTMIRSVINKSQSHSLSVGCDQTVCQNVTWVSLTSCWSWEEVQAKAMEESYHGTTHFLLVMI